METGSGPLPGTFFFKKNVKFLLLITIFSKKGETAWSEELYSGRNYCPV